MEIYTARPGDSLASAARRLGRSPAELARLNQLNDPRRLTPGLALVSPGGAQGPRRTAEISARLDPDAPEELLEELLPWLSYVLPPSRRLLPEGELSQGGDGRLKSAAEKAGAVTLLPVANLDEAGRYSPEAAHRVLAGEDGRQALLDTLLAALEEGGYGGVHLSFCYLYPFDREGYNSFLALAAPALHQAGYTLSTALIPREEEGRESRAGAAQDYTAHGLYADRVTLLAYDWGYSHSAPQAVSPADRVRAALDYAAGKLPPGKTLLALSNQGYDWPLPWRLGVQAKPLSNAAAANLAVAVGAEVKFDPLSRGSSFQYTDALDRRRLVWYEDARGVRAKLRLAEEYGLAGLSLIWPRRPDRAALTLLQSALEPEKLF